MTVFIIQKADVDDSDSAIILAVCATRALAVATIEADPDYTTSHARPTRSDADTFQARDDSGIGWWWTITEHAVRQ